MEDVGKLILRISLGLLVLLHGISKIRGGIGFITPMLSGIGLPPWVGYGVYIGEILAPVMLILGVFTRTGAFIVFVNMVFAIVLAHRTQLLSMNAQGGWTLELQGMYLAAALALVFLGPGRHALTRRF